MLLFEAVKSRPIVLNLETIKPLAARGEISGCPGNRIGGQNYNYISLTCHKNLAFH
jgi:hypothetical protein